MAALAAQWQFDRLSGKAREAAEIASLGTGLSLSTWLARLISETSAAEGVPPSGESAKIIEFAREARPHAVSAAERERNPENAARTASAAANPALPLGATMLATSAIIPAQLGTRKGEDIPATLLADIATRGVRQPVAVRRAQSNPGHYEIVCGHRRWRAAQRVGLAQIPATIVTYDDAAAILASLAENLKLGDLSPIDEAQVYLRLLTQFAVDASAITAAIDRDRRHIVQSMRLMGLPPLVRHLIGSGSLPREQAYLLLEAPHPEDLADAILAENLSADAVRRRLGSKASEAAKP